MTFGLAVPIDLVEDLVHDAERRGDAFTEREARMDLRLHVDAALQDPASWPTRRQLCARWRWEDRAVRSLLERRGAWLTAMETTPGSRADAWALVEEEMDRRSGELERRRRSQAAAEALVSAGVELLGLLDAAFRQDSARAAPGFRQGETEERREPPDDAPGTRQGSARIPPHARPSKPDSQTVRQSPPPTPAPGRGSLTEAAARWLSADGQALLPLVLSGRQPDEQTTREARSRMRELRLLPAGRAPRTVDLAAALVAAAPSVAVAAPPAPRPPDRPRPVPSPADLEALLRDTLAVLDVDPDERTAFVASCAPALVSLGGGEARLALPSWELVAHAQLVHGELLDLLCEALGATVLQLDPPACGYGRTA